MNIILLEDVEHVGKRGDLAEVADGYGRNYLIPQQKARLATEGTIKAIREEERQADRKRARSKEQARELAEELEDLLVVLTARVSGEEKIYGSVTPQQIAVELSDRGYDIDRRDIELEGDEPIRRLGVYTARVALMDDVTADLKVQIMPEGG
ncbi:MAG: 50S ribosomal protein L9 [Bacteroidetes bacterium QS_1_65_9]|nr:MAG: 50S ribosomal protein L9 [Bacteroidetes bacterium QS_8_68_15]PSQ84602.1 MAG: 50S ribosomal protein L9 [Bacteroidetes bacterium QS_1_65_9]